MATQAIETMNWNSLKGQFEKQLLDESPEIKNAVLELMKNVHAKHLNHQIFLLGTSFEQNWRAAVKDTDGFFHNVCPHCLHKYIHLEHRNKIEDYEINGSASSLEDVEYEITHDQTCYCGNCKQDIYHLSSEVSASYSNTNDAESIGDDYWNDRDKISISEVEELLEYHDIPFNGEFELERPDHWIVSDNEAPLCIDNLDRCLSDKIEFRIEIDLSEQEFDYQGFILYGYTDPINTYKMTPEWIKGIIND
jgi:hypothetical protein